MAYVIAERCIGVKDTACVDPVDCINPKKNCPCTGLSGLRDFCVGRPAREVEALYGDQRNLRPRRQIHAGRICQARGEVSRDQEGQMPSLQERDDDETHRQD